ncbi:hypothetical protein bthur0011_58180 [Bacillus thuringiensis serovar huazhongensis BGSC 4BD1]|nr:hypothetical protein bthur0011_58180 [Bacillus thuringiensis serovar huazhongensis BGSC 4BD1]
MTEYEKEIVQKGIETVVGLDFAMDGLYVSSEDEKANYPKFYHKMLDRLAGATSVRKTCERLSAFEYTTYACH